MKKRFLVPVSLSIILFSIFLGACVDNDIFPSTSGPTNEGWVGIYINSGGFNDLRQSTTGSFLNSQVLFNLQDTTNSVRISNFRYRVDSLRGIIILNDFAQSDRRSLAGYYFVPGIRSVRGDSGEIIVDNFSDEVVLSVVAAPELSIIERRVNQALPFIYPEEKPERIETGYFADRSRYFECYDETRGSLIGWSLEYGRDYECFLN